ncbi:MAG: hypothetical protein A49_20330 [Methyloceanibacter sp.]|nr:MAG: hypothetical protein A49_20330 [Methyloceanibacter sp.]
MAACGGYAHEQNLGRARQQDRIERPRPRRQATIEKRLQYAVDLPFAPQGGTDDGAGEGPVPWRQIEHGAVPDTAEHVVERLPLLQDGLEDAGGGPPRGQADLMVARAGQCLVRGGGCGHVIVSKVLRVLKSRSGAMAFAMAKPVLEF